MCARRRSLFLCLAKERNQRKATPRLRPLRCAQGQTCVALLSGWAAELTSRLQRSVQTAAASQITKRLHAALQPPPRQKRAAGAASRGDDQPPGPSLRSALCARGRAQRWPDWFPYPCGRAEKRRAGGGRGQRSMPTLRPLTRCSCLSGALQAQSEFCSAPRQLRDAGLPLRAAQGSQTWGRLSLGDFSLAKQRKVPRPPGRDPASYLRKGPQKLPTS